MNSITISALVHSMWQRGHYILQQVFRDNFNVLLNLLVYVREAGTVCLICYGLQVALELKIPLLKNWVWLTGPLAHLIIWQQTYNTSCQHPWLKTAGWHWIEVIPNVLAFLPGQMHKCSSGDGDHMKYVILICWWLQLTFHSVMIVCKYMLTNCIFPCVSYFISKSYKYFHPNLYIT